jgi:hypothetical protein
MSTVEKFLIGGLFVAALVVMVKPGNNANQVIDSLGGALAKVYSTLEGNVVA